MSIKTFFTVRDTEMRDLVIHYITGSGKWQRCVDSGEGDELPDLNKLSDHQLLAALEHFVYAP